MQMKVSAKAVREQAAAALATRHDDVRVNLIALALKGRKVNMDKVVAMIDEMTVLLGKEQEDDDAKKAYCEKEIDTTEDKIKELERKISDLEKATEEAQGSVETLTHEIKASTEGIEDLDKSVEEATAQRKE